MEVVKFGYICFKNLFTDIEEEEIKIGEDTTFSTKNHPLEDGTWREWIGRSWDDIKEANALIKIEIPTTNPDVVDAENNLLESRANAMWNTIKICGSFCLENAYFICGTKKDNKLEIRQYSKFPKWYPAPRDYQMPITESRLEEIYQVNTKLRKVYTELKKDKFFRFNRGLLCFLKGLEEAYLDFRLPQAVRALEGLILPEKGKTTKQFINRASIWWPDNGYLNLFEDDKRKTLSEIYDMRCDFDHLHGVKDRYEEIGIKRAQECEELVRIAYKSVLLDNEILAFFNCNENVQKFWKKSKK